MRTSLAGTGPTGSGSTQRRWRSGGASDRRSRSTWGDVGNPRAFNFWAGAWGDSPDGSYKSNDTAPNVGTWNYRVGTATDGSLATGRFIIEHLPSDNPHIQGLIDWIDESDRLDWLARRLNAAYALPEDIHVVVMEDTHGPAYFPDLRAITMPPEFLDTILYLFNRDYR
ncbi:MAG: hypothetical protein OXG37_04620 [Actinomycetia bacterium]|nr:hypothetical protein [Actinomycetes bacterium]